MNLAKEIKIFENYVTNNFDIQKFDIDLKFYHSKRVMEKSINIAKYLNLDKKEIETAAVIGLLHDIGRFYQFSKYKTYNDLESIDHADAGVEFLFDMGKIENYQVPKDRYLEISNAIKYHNKYKYPHTLSKNSELMCKIIRDADKLDIFELYSNGKFKMKDDNSKINEDYLKQFFNEQQIKRNKKQSDNDFILVGLAMVYDLNFKYSFLYLKEKDIINKWYDQLNNKEIFKEYFEKINNYIDRKIKE